MTEKCWSKFLLENLIYLTFSEPQRIIQQFSRNKNVAYLKREKEEKNQTLQNLIQCHFRKNLKCGHDPTSNLKQPKNKFFPTYFQKYINAKKYASQVTQPFKNHQTLDRHDERLLFQQKLNIISFSNVCTQQSTDTLQPFLA